VTITIFEHAALKFQVVRFDAVLTIAELVGLGALHEERADWARADAIHLIGDTLDVSGLDYALLDKFRAHYRELHKGLDFHLLRRSAWVCANAGAWSFLEYWLADRHSRDGQGTDVCLVSTLDEANLLFDDEELEAVRRWQEFNELHRLHAPHSQSGNG
jgi:hypothetical protein